MDDVSKIEETFSVIDNIVKDSLKSLYFKCRFELLKYGSTVNGLALRGDSDLDLTIIIDDLEINHIDILNSIKKGIRWFNSKNNKNRFTQEFVREITSGVILVVKDTKYNMDIEISVNKVIEVYNSALLYTYAMCD